tara:strand:- start:250 stop:657 length:408 start_codon:yes stop_codon:yes gene_type:complete
MKLKKLNLTFGIILLLGFFISGQYLKHYFKPNHLDQLLMRSQIRSNHIYVLLIASLNIISYKIKNDQKIKVQKIIDTIWRTSLIIAGIFFVFAFFMEHTGDIGKRGLTLIGTICTLISVGFFLLNEIIFQFKKNT